MNDKQTFESKIDWKTLDQVIRKWAVMSQFEKDLENYEKLKQSQE